MTPSRLVLAQWDFFYQVVPGFSPELGTVVSSRLSERRRGRICRIASSKAGRLFVRLHSTWIANL